MRHARSRRRSRISERTFFKHFVRTRRDAAARARDTCNVCRRACRASRRMSARCPRASKDRRRQHGRQSLFRQSAQTFSRRRCSRSSSKRRRVARGRDVERRCEPLATPSGARGRTVVAHASDGRRHRPRRGAMTGIAPSPRSASRFAPLLRGDDRVVRHGGGPARRRRRLSGARASSAGGVRAEPGHAARAADRFRTPDSRPAAHGGRSGETLLPARGGCRAGACWVSPLLRSARRIRRVRAGRQAGRARRLRSRTASLRRRRPR